MAMLKQRDTPKHPLQYLGLYPWCDICFENLFMITQSFSCMNRLDHSTAPLPPDHLPLSSHVLHTAGSIALPRTQPPTVHRLTSSGDDSNRPLHDHMELTNDITRMFYILVIGVAAAFLLPSQV
jgi:hypothetical protein